MEEHEVFGEIGEEGFVRLCAAFYKQVPTDDILGPMYPQDDLEGAEQRLRSFLIYRFGGPQDYLHDRGHPRMRMRHAPFAITQQARDRWLSIMETAMQQAELPLEAQQVLRQFFTQMSQFLINRN